MIIYYADCEQFISELSRDARVKDTVVYSAQDCVLIAYLPTNVFTRSEGTALYKKVETLAAVYFDEREFYISCDADAFYILKNARSDADAERARQLIVARQYV